MSFRALVALAFCALLALASVSSVSFVFGAKAPPNDGLDGDVVGPQYVFVQMQMNEISKIDGVEQAFHSDFYMLTTWAVPLNGTGFEGKASETLTSDDIDKLFWDPQLDMVNAVDTVNTVVSEPYSFIDVVPFDLGRLRPGWKLPAGWGWITSDQRYQCDFSTPLNMRDFPFDQQFMQLLIESYWSVDQVIIRWALPDKIHSLVPDAVQVIGWGKLDEAAFNADPYVVYDYNNRNYDRLYIRVALKRDPSYYLTKIIAGAMLLVYMCIWIFALSVDEADRMMGTLSIFAGLVTFLFVASGDTPKVPYQTRLDVFMLYSFFNVTLMLFIHGTLFFWREDDVEELLEKREEERLEHERAEWEAEQSKHNGGAIEMGEAHKAFTSPASPSGVGRDLNGASVQVHVQAAPVSAVDKEKPYVDPSRPGGPSSRVWRVRHHPYSEWTLKKWFAGLHLTRKCDVIVIPTLAIIYSVGIAVILGRASHQLNLMHDELRN